MTAPGRGGLSREALAERLLLAVYAYGTNTGIRAIGGGAMMVDAGGPGTALFEFDLLCTCQAWLKLTAVDLLT